jgi:hypothetical protein
MKKFASDIASNMKSIMESDKFQRVHGKTSLASALDLEDESAADVDIEEVDDFAADDEDAAIAKIPGSAGYVPEGRSVMESLVHYRNLASGTPFVHFLSALIEELKAAQERSGDANSAWEPGDEITIESSDPTVDMGARLIAKKHNLTALEFFQVQEGLQYAVEAARKIIAEADPQTLTITHDSDEDMEFADDASDSMDADEFETTASRAISLLVTASDLLDRMGLEKLASASLQSVMIVEAKKKSVKEEKGGKKDKKEEKKDEKKDGKKSDKKLPPFLAKKVEKKDESCAKGPKPTAKPAAKPAKVEPKKSDKKDEKPVAKKTVKK